MTDLWDWTDVAALGVIAAQHGWQSSTFDRKTVAAAIRYGYEQAQRDAPQFGITPRPAVLWFAEHMELKLRENDHKGGWLGIGMECAQRRMREEALELEQAIVRYSFYNDDGSPKTEQQDLASRLRIIREAADVANFAMMIADEWRPRHRSERRDLQDSNNGVTDEKVTHPQAVKVAPQSAAAIPPVASEFPRVWVTLARNPFGGSVTIPIMVYSRPGSALYASEEYVRISELERLREAARRLRTKLSCLTVLVQRGLGQSETASQVAGNAQTLIDETEWLLGGE